MQAHRVHVLINAFTVFPFVLQGVSFEEVVVMDGCDGPT